VFAGTAFCELGLQEGREGVGGFRWVRVWMGVGVSEAQGSFFCELGHPQEAQAPSPAGPAGNTPRTVLVIAPPPTPSRPPNFSTGGLGAGAGEDTSKNLRRSVRVS